jgi:Domain of unknown function (DUF4386)
MTRTTSARVAGTAFLLYIAIGISAMVLSGRATAGEGVAAKLAGMAAQAGYVRAAAVLDLAAAFAAIVLAVTLYGITRDEDHELAMLGLACRVTEGAVIGASMHQSLDLLWLATTDGASAPDPATAQALGAFFLGQQWTPTIAATFFAVGSTFFSWLLLRGRMVPAWLAQLGVFASVLLVIALPLRIGGLGGSGLGPWLIWLPMLVFEVGLALWFLVKGVAAPRPSHAR